MPVLTEGEARVGSTFFGTIAKPDCNISDETSSTELG